LGLKEVDVLKIAAVIPPASMNLGNDFFSLGGIHAAKQVFPNGDFRIIEFFDSGEKGFNVAKLDRLPGQTCFFTPATLEWIRDEADLIMLFGGCCLHANLSHLFEPLLQTGTPFVGWGLSPTSYNQSDIDYAKYVADRSKLLITRDDRIYQMVGEYQNFMSGLDGGWFLGDSLKFPDRTSDYNVINIEKGGTLDVQASTNFLSKIDPSMTTFLVSNNCERQYHYYHSKSLSVTNARHLWSLYANASFVITTRAHTTICCLASGTPVTYVGKLDNRVEGLFESVGIHIKNGDLDDKDICKQKVEEAKTKFINEVRTQLQ